jgi:hypothetical protein
MWEVCYEHGNDFLGDVRDVELAAMFTGKPGTLCQALLDCGLPGAGLIEYADQSHTTFKCHDLYENAPDYVRKRKRRAELRKSNNDNEGDRSLTAKRPHSQPSPAQPSPAQEETERLSVSVTDRSATNKDSSASAEGRTVSKISPQEFFDRWVKFALEHPGVPPCRKLTEERARKIRSRLAKAGWFEDFREAVRALPLGGSDKWQPTLDWLVANETNIYRILEGAFDWRVGDDPALKRLQEWRRKASARQREAEASRQRTVEKAEIPQTRSCIAGILNNPESLVKTMEDVD